MNDNNNFDFRKETREFTAEDGSFIRITGPAFLFEEEDDEEATVDETGDTDHSSENSESVSELPPSITEVPDSAPPSLDLLTVLPSKLNFTSIRWAFTLSKSVNACFKLKHLSLTVIGLTG